MLPVESPFKVFTGRDGKPLDRGYVYFGVVNQNPITSPITVYWDAAGLQPAAQPLRTENGYIVRAGTPANVFIDGSYSELVQDNRKRQVFYARTSDDFSIASFVFAFILQIASSTGSTLIGFLQAGAGAVLRTLQDRLRDRITAFDFMTPALIADAKLAVPVLDHTVALQAAMTAAAGKILILGPYNFRCTAGLNLLGTLRGDGANINFVAGTISKLINQTAEGDITGLTINGIGVPNCENGLFVDTDFVTTRTSYWDMQIKNIANADNTKGCNGALFFKSSGAVNLNSKLDIKIDVDSVTATANAVIGDTAGSSTGIFLSFNGAGTDSQVLIHDSIVKNILPAEDSGGIQLFIGDHTVAGALGSYSVQNCRIYNSRKRGVKVQAQNATVRDVTVYGQNTEVGFDTYAISTKFEDCNYLLGTSTAFRSSGPDTIFNRCKANSVTQQPILRIEAGSSNALIRDGIFTNTAALGSVANNLVLIVATGVTTFENTTVSGSTNTGSGFSVGNNCDIRFRGGSITGTDYGVYLAFSVGTFTFSEGANMSVASFGFFRTGATAQLIKCNDASITGSIGFNLVSGGAAATVDLCNVRVNTTNSGCLASAGSRVINCQFTNPGVAGTAISAGNSTHRDNRISGYAVGISYTFTTTAEVANNVTIGTTLPYETTGFVAFVNNDNFSR